MSATHCAVARAEGLVREFQRIFGQVPRLFQAPGRVNLIGEHTDYNDGFVMPMAIGFSTWVAASRRSDEKFVVRSTNLDETHEFDLTKPLVPQRRWSDYVAGVVGALSRDVMQIGGMNMLIEGDVPLGAGLSSSASLEVVTALAVSSLARKDLPAQQLALLCQRAENEFVGARCGIMDQFVSANARDGQALLLDCRSLQFELVPIPDTVRVVICNSMIKHDLAAGEYNERRAQCEEAVTILRRSMTGIRALRDVNLQHLQQHERELPEPIYRRARHVVTENERVLRAAAALKDHNLAAFGAMMLDSHESLRDDYEVSCVELDVLVELAMSAPGAIGARMTGGGFGGCTVNLVRAEAVAEFCSCVGEGYRRKTAIDPEIYVTAAAAGATEVVV